MSYDIVVFEPSLVPWERETFYAWFEANADATSQNRVPETPALLAWFEAMLPKYPAMNGPRAASPPSDDAHVTAYDVGSAIIYCDFRWSVAEDARCDVELLAQTQGVGVYAISDARKIIFPPGRRI